MSHQLLVGVAATLLAFLRAVPLAEAQSSEIPFKLNNHLILVEGSAGNDTKLRFLVDTGATHSIVDDRVVRRLGLTIEPMEPGKYRGTAFGRKMKLRKVLLPRLRLGTLQTSMSCFAADLSGFAIEIDGLIGLDLLQRRSASLIDCATRQIANGQGLTIDFETRKIIFGRTECLEHQALLDTGETDIAVAVNIQGQELRLALDTGWNRGISRTTACWPSHG
jgi:hypothetical protein